MAEKPYDLAIVGAGMAGCVLAARISENGVNSKTGEPLKIALIDRGPYYPGEVRPGYGHPLRRKMFTNVMLDFAGRYLTSPGVPPGVQRRIPLRPEQEVHVHRTAAIVGGGGLHFTAITHVPYEIDYKVWVDETGADWTYQNMKASAEDVNRNFNIHAKPEAALCRADRLFRDAVRSMGYTPDDATVAKKNCLYSGYCDGVNKCKYDARQGSFVSYLPSALKHGVEVIPDTMIERIVIEKNGRGPVVKGLEFTQRGARHTMDVSQVIVSCGNFGTTPLLLRSGYGSRELAGSGLLVENSNVGYHTDNRCTLESLVGVFDDPLSDGEYHDGGTAGAYYLYHDTTPDKQLERIEITVRAREIASPNEIAVASDAPEFGREHKDYMRDSANPKKKTMTRALKQILSRCDVDISLVRPRGVRGYVNEWGEQIYQANDPSILKPLTQGRELAREILQKMGARAVIGMEKPARVRRLFTWVGACHVGTDRKNSVVNPYFESHDIDGLFICDASVVPRAATQGYAGTVATVAAFASRRIVEHHFTRG